MTIQPDPPTAPLPTLHPHCAGHTTCHTTATYLVLVHQVDYCHADNLTPDGNTILLLCHQHLQHISQLTTREINRRMSRLPKGVVNHCNTCWRPVVTLDDVLEAEML